MDINWDELREQVKEADNNISNNKIRDYKQIKRLYAYVDGLSKMGMLSSESKDMVNVLKIAISKYNEQLMGFIANDLDEIRKCLDAKAYKAALILAGSVLEAFLIDWLSEIDGKDYFSQPYIIIENDKQYKARGLSDYIEAINEIEKPDWMETSEKAHYIRKKRNLVHANLCLKNSEEINEETCRKVIEYLEYIIDTRFDKFMEKKNNKESAIFEVDSEMGSIQIETFKS